MTTWLSSLRDFSIRFFGRWWLLLPAILLALPNLLERSWGIEWNPPTGLVWTIFGLSLFVAAWLTYREAWVDSASSRLGMLLRLIRAGENLVTLLDRAIQFAYEPNSQLQGEEQFVADIRELQINPWLELVRDELTPGELNMFDFDPGRSSVNDIDLFTDLKGLRSYLAERVNRLDDICEDRSGRL